MTGQEVAMPQKMRIWACVLIGALLLAACRNDPVSPTQTPQSTPLAAWLEGTGQRQPPTAVSDAIIAEADAEYLLLTNLYARISPSVVNVEVVIGVPGRLQYGRGSGFVYDTDGHIITNAHVVDSARSIHVTFDDGYTAEAALVGKDVYSDIAVIKVNVDSSRLIPLTLADSDRVRVGERAVAIGNPFGLSSSMTVGIVSGVGRQLSSATLIDNTISPGFQNPHIIQVDTDINPGNSGGPLLNSFGEVIGVNTAISTSSGVFQGVGFAVPSNTVQRVVPELIASGQVDYSWMGIVTVSSEISLAALQEPLGLPLASGVLITGITPGSPAADAGLRGGNQNTAVRGTLICAGGDIITGVDGYPVADMDALVAYLIRNTVPGDTITLQVVREGSLFDVPLTLQSRPEGGTVFTESCGP